MKLENEIVRLELFKTELDFDYLLEVEKQDKYRYPIDSKFIRPLIKQYGIYFWKVYYKPKNLSAGVVFILKRCDFFIFNKIYTLDGFRDETTAKQIDNKISCSYEAGKLVGDWFLLNINDTLYSLHNIENKPASLLCIKLGFKKIIVLDMNGLKIKVFKRVR